MYGQLPFWVIGFQSPVASRASATGLSLPDSTIHPLPEVVPEPAEGLSKAALGKQSPRDWRLIAKGILL